MDKLTTLWMLMIFLGSIFAAAGGFFLNRDSSKKMIELRKQNNNMMQQNKLQTEKIQSLEKLTVDYKIIDHLMPGNEPDPTITVQKKPPEDAIKLYLGSCLAWWKPSFSHTCSIVTINNEPALILSLEEDGLCVSGKIRREDGKEVMNLIKNKFVRNPDIYHDFQLPNKCELIVSGKSGERLLHVKYLNEKAIAIQGTFYDSIGTRILTINESEIVDMDNNHMQGASFGGNENIFTYQTLQRYQLTVAVTKPASIKSDYRIDYIHDGKIVENPSEATVIFSNTGTEPIRLGVDGEMELAITGNVLDLTISPQMAKNDYIEWNGKILKFTSLLINPRETKTINILMQGEGECDISHATLRDGTVIIR
jgi:hypothetical protein